MSRQSRRVGFFKNKNVVGTGTTFVPSFTIVSETLSNNNLTYNLAFSTNLDANTTLKTWIAPLGLSNARMSAQIIGGTNIGTTTLDSNGNGNITFTANVSPEIFSVDANLTFQVYCLNPSNDDVLFNTSGRTISGTPSYDIQLAPQGSYTPTYSNVTISGTPTTLIRMDVGSGTQRNMQLDPLGTIQSSYWDQQYNITANRPDVAIESMVISGGGSAVLNFNASDSGAGGGGGTVKTGNANITMGATYGFNIGTNGRFTWALDHGANTSYSFYSTGVSAQESYAFANSAFQVGGANSGPVDGIGFGGSSSGARGGANGGAGARAGGGAGSGNPFGGGTSVPGTGGFRFETDLNDRNPASTGNATHGGNGDDGFVSTFTGTSVTYAAGGGGEGHESSSFNGTAGAGNLNYGSGGSVASTGGGQYARTFTDSQPGVIYLKHLQNGDRRIFL
jgi:hypothetical protein